MPPAPFYSESQGGVERPSPHAIDSVGPMLSALFLGPRRRGGGEGRMSKLYWPARHAGRTSQRVRPPSAVQAYVGREGASAVPPGCGIAPLAPWERGVGVCPDSMGLHWLHVRSQLRQRNLHRAPFLAVIDSGWAGVLHVQHTNSQRHLQRRLLRARPASLTASRRVVRPASTTYLPRCPPFRAA